MTAPTASAAVAALQARAVAEPDDALRHAAHAALAQLEHAEFAALVAAVEDMIDCEQGRHHARGCSPWTHAEDKAPLLSRILDRAQEALRG